MIFCDIPIIIVSQFILKADDELLLPSSGELKSIKEFLETGEQRMRIAATLAENEKRLFNKPVNSFGRNALTLISLVEMLMGSANGFMPTRLRLVPGLITYGVLVGDKEPIEKIGLIGVREMYNSGTVPGMVDDPLLKKAGLDLLSQEDAAQQRPTLLYHSGDVQRSSWRFLLFFNSQAHAANFFALIALNFKDFEPASR